MYTYAFINWPVISLSLPLGIENDLEIVHSGAIGAIVEPGIAFDHLQIDDELLLRAALEHDRVICELFTKTTLLPLRFGTRFLSKEGLVAHLEEHADTYLEKLRNLKDKAEHTLKLIPIELPPGLPLPETTGREYFLAKKKRLEEQQAHQELQVSDLETLLLNVADLADDLKVAEPQESGIQRIHFLAERKLLSSLDGHLQGWQVDCTTWTIELERNLPPYHFV
jgi:Gas vesicle synthesis protein GvpL/GvpF